MKNLFKTNSDKVHKVLMAIKLAIGSIAGSAFAMNNEKLAFWLLVSVAVIDVVMSFFSSNDQGRNI